MGQAINMFVYFESYYVENDIVWLHMASEYKAEIVMEVGKEDFVQYRI